MESKITKEEYEKVKELSNIANEAEKALREYACSLCEKYKNFETGDIVEREGFIYEVIEVMPRSYISGGFVYIDPKYRLNRLHKKNLNSLNHAPITVDERSLKHHKVEPKWVK